MRRLFACLRRGHWPRMHRGVCLRCEPCLTCRAPGVTACIGRCSAERLS